MVTFGNVAWRGYEHFRARRSVAKIVAKINFDELIDGEADRHLATSTIDLTLAPTNGAAVSVPSNVQKPRNHFVIRRLLRFHENMQTNDTRTN